MRNYSLNPTEENAYKLLRENPIQRNEYVFQFVRLLTHMEDNCYSVALNGDWGSGKTFFVKQVKLILDAHNPQFRMEDETRREIRTLYKADEKPNSYATVYYDAWTYDNHDDPILSLVYAASQSGQKADLSDSPSHVLEAAAAVFDAFTGKNLTSLVKGLGKVEIKDRLSEIRDTEELKSKIHEFIDTLTAEKANRLVFFIDELDRCKPDYAIRFLERIKHYFDDERITFVFSVSLTQLQWTISKGQEDENGILFVCFPVTAIAAVLSRSPMTVKRSLNELETAGLIMRVRQGVGEPNRIYVLIPGKEDAALA